jgi:dihydroxyacetone kinase phosphoprotein-dependent L subunit
MTKAELTLPGIEIALRTMARVAIENERYFCELDGEIGDADFGTSLATGFRAILAELESIERTDIGAFLVRVGTIFVSTVGGTSGPIWGTAFLRAGMRLRGKNTVTLADLADMGNSAVQGIMARGGAAQGDKTVLDALIPALTVMEEYSRRSEAVLKEALAAAAAAAEAAVEGTRQWPAKRGRQSYASERSIGTLDPGIVAVAMMAKAVAAERQIGSEGRGHPAPILTTIDGDRR